MRTTARHVSKMTRQRIALLALGAGVFLSGVAVTGTALAQVSNPYSAAAAAKANIDVWRGPNCEHFDSWLANARYAAPPNSVVAVHNVNNMTEIDARLGVPADLASCHIAVINGYVISGHVGSNDIRRLLIEQPAATGIAVSAMPVSMQGAGSAGEVMLFGGLKGTQVYDGN